jgi:hypothetical protein
VRGNLPRGPDAYANRTLVNTYLADRRRLRARELLGGRRPDPAAAGTAGRPISVPSGPDAIVLAP